MALRKKWLLRVWALPEPNKCFVLTFNSLTKALKAQSFYDNIDISTELLD